MSSDASDEIEWKEANYDEMEAEAAKKMLDAERRSKATNLPQLKVDIQEFIRSRYQAELPSGVRLVELNRRFGVIAARFGTTVRDLVIELIGDKIMAVKRNGAVVVYDKELHKETLSLYPLTDFETRTAITESMLDRAYSATKSSTAGEKPKTPWD